MEYASFYGGRKGASFVLVKSFDTIEVMTEAFRQGNTYTEVNYDEYVIINTVNKNHPDNGKIFKRGYDYSSGRTINWTNGQGQTAEIDAGGAVYIGSIVGPAGQAPQLQLTTLLDAQQRAETQGFDVQTSSGSFDFDNNHHLVPGKQGNIYNDEIKWYCTSIRDVDNNTTTAYVGLKIPYHVFEFVSEAVAPYRNHQYTDTSAVNKIDDNRHPFYSKYKISIPKGVKGNEIRNFRVMTPTNNSPITIPHAGTSQSYTLELGKQILVYDYYTYDHNDQGEIQTYYVGDYNQITGVSIGNQTDLSDLTISYSHQDPQTFSNIFKRITNIALTENGILQVTYNIKDAQQNYQKDIINSAEDNRIKWLNSLSLSNNGILTATYNTSNTPENINSDPIKWLDSIVFDTNTVSSNYDNVGKLTVSYNTSNTPVTLGRIIWPTAISLNTTYTDTANIGKVELTYCNGEKDTLGRIKWIKDFTLDTSNKNFKITYTDNTITTIGQNLTFLQTLQYDDTTGVLQAKTYGSETYDIINTRLNYVKNLAVQTSNNSGQTGTGDQRLYATYMNNESHPISDPINYIMDMRINDINKHLVVLYSDPAHRPAPGTPGYISNITDHANSNNTISYATWAWRDLGSVINQGQGVLVGKNFTWYDLYEVDNVDNPDINDIIDKLNIEYANGYEEGKIVTVGNVNQEKLFFGFDYNFITDSTSYKGWYYLGLISPSSTQLTTVMADIHESNSLGDFKDGSLWFRSIDQITVTYNLINVISSNRHKRVQTRDGFSTVVTPNSGYRITTNNVSVIMKNQLNQNIDITSSAWNSQTQTINITNITGNIIINISASLSS